MNNYKIQQAKTLWDETINAPREDFLTPDLQNGTPRDVLIAGGLEPLELEKHAQINAMIDEIQREMGIPLEYFNKIKNRVFINPMLAIFEPGILGGFHTKAKFMQLNSNISHTRNVKLALAHVFFHEYTHMTGIFDEAVTEMMAIKKMREVYGTVGITSGYVDIVDQLETLIGSKNYDELMEMMNFGTEDEQLLSVLAEVTLKPILDNKNAGQFTQSTLLDSARYKFSEILKLFPRLSNEAEERNVDAFTPSAMSWYHINEVSLLYMVADKLLRNSENAYKILREMYARDDSREAIASGEFNYIFDWAENNGMSGDDVYFYYQSLQAQFKHGYEM